MKYFQNCKNLDDVKSKYRELAKEHHPDKGGDTKVMQEVNLQYSEAKKRFKNGNYSQNNQPYEGGGFADFMEAFHRHQREQEARQRKAEEEARKREQETRRREEEAKRKREVDLKRQAENAEKEKYDLFNRYKKPASKAKTSTKVPNQTSLF